MKLIKNYFRDLRFPFSFVLFLLFILAGGASFGVTKFIALKSRSPAAAAARIVSACTNRAKEHCYASFLEDYARSAGGTRAFEALSLIQGKDREAIGCHFIAHGIGYGAYLREPQNWQKLVQTLPQACSYGAIHGVIEKYLATLPQGRLTREVIPTICGQEPIADCNHIVGHLILVETGADIPAALKLCGVFPEERQLDFCATGVFMEHSTALNLIAHKLAPESWKNWPARVPEIVSLCRSQTDDRFIAACWEESVHAALEKFYYEPQRIFDYCGQAPIADAHLRCRRHAIGIMAAHINFDLEKARSICGVPQPDAAFEEECYGHVTASLMATDPAAGIRVDEFCRTLPASYQSTCLRYAGRNPVYKNN